ncbi:uncharacterized protein LOC142230901 [Haematobia irritans]|uniref:uncharacterized protein LOC142230901 n=1 Tax=Haematobia irritans TaxID=7368 RepID=UPI003F4FB105
MGDLPTYRVNANHPFYEVGCDYAGPIQYKQHNGRKALIVKAYVAVFICLVIKTVHLELVTDLSSEAFLAALDSLPEEDYVVTYTLIMPQIFRGLPKSLENFIKWSPVAFYSTKCFHFGGAWDSTVKSVKYHLKRTLGQATLNYEELEPESKLY